MIRPLFVLGASRSGTTALVDYLNQHEEILLCMERYKYVPEVVTPEVFTYQRILDYVPQQGSGETNIPRERHEEILAGKDPAKLRWIGDKQGAQTKRFKAFSKNNPGAHFLITYRPIEEVVESFEARAKNPEDPYLGGKDGLKIGVGEWNRAMQSAREYLESSDEPNGLIVSYHDFFYHRAEDYARLLSEFLEVEFGDSTLQAWANTSREFEDHRRKKAPITEEKAAYIREHKDHAAEEWVLERIARQWSEPGLYKRTSGEGSGRRKLAAALMQERAQTKPGGNTDHDLERSVKRLDNERKREQRKTRALRRENRSLDGQINHIEASRSWKLLSKLHSLRSAILEARLRNTLNSGARKVLNKLVRARDALPRRSRPLAKRLTGAFSRILRQDSRVAEQESGRGDSSEPAEPTAKDAAPERAAEEKRELHQRRLEHRKNRELQQRRLEEHKERRRLQQQRIRLRENQKKIRNVKGRLDKFGITERALGELEELATDGGNPSLQAQAAWELTLWYANQRSEEGARLCLEYLPVALRGKNEPARLHEAAIVEAEARQTLGDIEAARLAVSRAPEANFPADLLFASTNLEASEAARIELINEGLRLYGTPEISFDASTDRPLLDSLKPVSDEREQAEAPDGPKVSVIVPVYNAEDVIQTALDSVLSQTWSNLEVLVVDDCSTDATASLVEHYVEMDSRVQLIRAETNGGAYVARNLALRVATGELVTCHDADDWSHPEKIEKQVLHLLANPLVVGNTSQHARATPDLRIYRRRRLFAHGFYVFSNTSSLMFRYGPVMDSIGYWDRVRFSADSEFKRRIEKVFGNESVVDVPTGPLSFTRQSNDSLSHSVNSGIGVPMGPRREYHESYIHFQDTMDAESLRYEFLPAKRPFPVPEPMWPERETRETTRRHFNVILASDFRLLGSSNMSNVEEIKAQKRMGLRTGLLQMSRYDLDPGRTIDQKIRGLLDGDQVQMLVYGEEVSCDVLVLRHPSILQEWHRYMPDVEAEDVHVIANQTPMRSYGDGAELDYNIGRCEKNLQRYFGKPGVWHPIGPAVRETLHQHHAEELEEITLASEDWLEVIDVEEWRRESRPQRGPRPRIGRHSRDHYLKWYSDREELLAAYPDSEDYEVHVLGGAEAPRKLLGSLPENWHVLEFGEMHPKDFLSTLEVFVHYTHPDLVEAFGRAILEAMAVGVPAILPHHYREVFGEAAIYAKPSEVKETVDLLMSDPGYYELQVELARNYAEKHFGYTKHAERLGKQIHS